MFREKPFYLDDDLNIPYGSSYLFYNYEYDRPIICSFNSGTRQQKWQVSVPIASSIEATMEWLDRVAKDQFIPHFGPVSPLTTTGFEWDRYSGPSGIALESFVPGVSGNKIRGYPIHSSGFWNKFRENLRFARDATILGINGTTFNELNNYTLTQQIVNEVSVDSQLPYPKITDEFYHNFIPNMYKAIPYFGGFTIYTLRAVNNVYENLNVSASVDVYNTVIMESSYIGNPIQTARGSWIQTFDDISFIRSAGYVSNINVNGFDFDIPSGVCDIYDYPSIFLGSKNFAYDDIVIMQTNKGVLGNRCEYSALAETKWEYHWHTAPLPVFPYTGNYNSSGTLILPAQCTVTYQSRRDAAIGLMVYPLSKRGSFGTLDTNQIWPDYISTSGDCYPFNVITGMNSGTMSARIRHIDNVLTPFTINTTKLFGFNIPPVEFAFEPPSFASLDYSADTVQSNNIRFVFGYYSPNNQTLESNIITSIINGNCTTLSIISTITLGGSGYNMSYNSARPSRTDFDFPVSGQFYAISDSFFPDREKTSESFTYTDKVYEIDIIPALTGIPPVSSTLLYFAVFSEPLLDPSGYINIGPLMLNKPPEVIYQPSGYYLNFPQGQYLFDKKYSHMYKYDIFNCVSPSVFDGTPVLDPLATPFVYSPPVENSSIKNLKSVQNDMYISSGLNGQTLNTDNYPCLFDVDFPYHCYSTKVTPGYLANGNTYGEKIDSITGEVSSGIIPRYGTMYGF